MRRFFFNSGLSIVIIAIFVVFLLMETVTGWHSYNNDQTDHHLSRVPFGNYLTTGHYIESVFENWESEFMEMGAFVWFTSFLFQKGSPESHPPGKVPKEALVTEKSPSLAQSRNKWVRIIYGQSLTIAFLLLFLAAFAMHLYGGARKFSDEQEQLGQARVTMLQFLGYAEFWFESFQNWQSEFLGIASMVILSIFLRQRGSKESKPIATPHSDNE